MPDDDELQVIRQEATRYLSEHPLLTVGEMQGLSDGDLAALAGRLEKYLNVVSEFARRGPSAMQTERGHMDLLQRRLTDIRAEADRRERVVDRRREVENFELDKRTYRWAVAAGVAGLIGVVIALAALLVQLFSGK